MMVKVFQTNRNGKIEFTKEELETLLNEVYWDGYRANSTWTWVTPLSYPIYTAPTFTTTDSKTNTTTITIGDKT